MHFITYGNHRFSQSKERIVKEAQEFGFTTTKAYGPSDLDDEFRSRFDNILKQPRIGGYGIWRPYIIKDALSKLKENEILVYLDAGCTINSKGKNRFIQYMEYINESEFGMISYQMIHPEKYWTTEQIFEYFKLDKDSPIRESGQYLDGILIMRKCPHVEKLVDLWLKAVYDNALMFTDTYNGQQQAYFRDNRHEQSVFSVIRKLHGSVVIPDETWFDGQFYTGNSLNFPFWATRIRG